MITTKQPTNQLWALDVSWNAVLNAHFHWVDTNQFLDFVTNQDSKSAKQLIFYIHIDTCLEKAFIPCKMDLLWSAQRLQICLDEKVTQPFYISKTYVIFHLGLHLNSTTPHDLFFKESITSNVLFLLCACSYIPLYWLVGTAIDS